MILPGERDMEHACGRCGTSGPAAPRLPALRRGVPQKTAREISGHKTDSVFGRYNIVSQADIVDAARKIEAGAKAVIHGQYIVEPESPSDGERQKKQKLIQSVS